MEATRLSYPLVQARGDPALGFIDSTILASATWAPPYRARGVWELRQDAHPEPTPHFPEYLSYMLEVLRIPEFLAQIATSLLP